MARLRYAYFAQAAAPAGRYGISFGDVLGHLWRARHGRGRLILKNIRHLDDLVHVTACTLDVSPAWADLVERYESILVRRCSERRDDMQVILLVRRMFSELRHDDSPTSGLGGYLGDRPLRNWLAQRTLGLLNRRRTAWFAGATEAPPAPFHIASLAACVGGSESLPFAVPARSSAGAAASPPPGCADA